MGLALFRAMERHDEDQPRNQRPVPRVPEPIDYDPFEMDWPWPMADARREVPAEPSRSELPVNAPVEESRTSESAEKS